MEPLVTDLDEDGAGPLAPATRWRRGALALIALVAATAMTIRLLPAPLAIPPEPTAAASSDTVRIFDRGGPSSIDPAHHGDLGSAQYVAQLFETLTAADQDLEIRPALAASWQVSDDGRRVTFTLRDGLVFSDGSPLKASDVVHSWRRLLYPRDPSPLASLFSDVKGVNELLAGQTTDTSTLGVSAPDDRTVVVDMVRGGGNLPAVVSSAPFAIVPASTGDGEFTPSGGTLVGSGAYTLESVSSSEVTLKANPHYWAGKPAIDTVQMVTTLGSGSEVEAFTAGEVDLTPVRFTDVGWLAYDKQLGPALRSNPDLSMSYYGFNTRTGPFADARLRRAFAMAVDWRRLASLTDPNLAVGATSMVPAGIQGTPKGDYLPTFDPAAAKQLLADAGHPDGAGLPTVTMLGGSYGAGFDGQVVAMIKANLGIAVDYQYMDGATYLDRLANDTPDIWSQSWVADYPSPNDFLGVLLGSASTANSGGWKNADFDAAIADATSASDPGQAEAAYARALAIVQDQAPTVPVVQGRDFFLARDGLLGAGGNGTGVLRLAGLAWSGQ